MNEMQYSRDRPARLYDQNQKEQWNFHHLRELWSIGYRESELSELVSNFPAAISPVLKKNLQLMQDLAINRIRLLNDANNQLRSSHAMRSRNQDDFNSAMWESDETFGILQMSLVPETGQRKGISLNSRFASLVSCMSLEDLRITFMRNESSLPCPTSDLLLLLVDDILHDFQDRERYFRLIRYRGQSIETSLV